MTPPAETPRPPSWSAGPPGPGDGLDPFPASGKGLIFLLAFLCFAALALRLYHVADRPLKFHPTRQHISALLARAMYVESDRRISADERAVALAARPAQGEPPATESLTSRISLLLGRGELMVPRALAAFPEIGEGVGHSTRTLFLARDYGLPLHYHGHIAGECRPTGYDFPWTELDRTSYDRGNERLQRVMTAQSPEFFIATDLDELERQPDPRDPLPPHPLISASEQFRLYDLKHAQRRH